MKPLFALSLLILFAISPSISQDNSDHNCFSILVGKKASVDGSVFFAHNEDNAGENFVDLHKVPRLQHSPGEKQIFVNSTDSIDEVPETYGYLWITGAAYNEEQYLNEWGVAITSDASRSKVVNDSGRIEHNMRRLVAERSRSAREAVKIAGTLVERYGYAFSGRVYSIADPNEAWVFEVAKGKHWIAKRVPDEEVVLVPNYYVITDFDISDTLNCLSSPEIIQYAVEQGWYNPDSAFNFREAYCRADRFYAPHNILRKLSALNKLSEKQYAYSHDFPFSFKPKRKVSIQDLMNILQNHYELTPFGTTDSNGSPHYNDTMRICNSYNDFSCITQLRSRLPRDIGNVLWISSRYPCMQPFIPWYYGIDKISPDYEAASYSEALENYNNKKRSFKALYPDHGCWVFDDFAATVDSSYGKEITSIKKWKAGFEKDIFKTVKAKEKEAVKLYKKNPAKARQLLTDMTNKFAGRVLKETKEKLGKMPGR